MSKPKKYKTTNTKRRKKRKKKANIFFHVTFSFCSINTHVLRLTFSIGTRSKIILIIYKLILLTYL